VVVVVEQVHILLFRNSLMFQNIAVE
jgi:hypothetical protein